MKRFLILISVFAGVLFAAPAAGAVSINVTTTHDDFGASAGSCSLREAITAAQTDAAMDGCQAGSGADVISLPAGDYKITRVGPGEDLNSTGDFDVSGTDALTIQPANTTAKVTVNGNGLDRVFEQQGNNSLSIRNLHVTGGALTGPNDGAGILNSIGTLSLDSVTVSGNNNDVSGGGVAVYSSLKMINSTVSGNTTKGRGGGLYFAGGANGTVKSSTITDNTADFDSTGSGDGGGGFADSGATSLSFYNVIDANNKDLSPMATGPDCLSGPFYFPRYVISTQALGLNPCLIGNDPGSNRVVTDVKLGPLADNGGQTPTHALLAGSPAVGSGGTTGIDVCPATDQTGRGRLAGSCDIGAVQYVPTTSPPGRANLLIRKILPKKKAIRKGRKLKVKVVVRNTGTAAASHVKVCLKLKRKKAKKALKIKGKPCRKFASVAAGKVIKPKIKLTTKRRAKPGSYKVQAITKGKFLSLGKESFKVKVR